MRLLISILMMSICISAHAGDYKKRNGALSIFSEGNHQTFNLNSSHGDSSGVCEISGEITPVAAKKGQRSRWIYSDQSSMCVAVITELGNGSMQVTTKDCDTYCGISEAGSMDGRYN